MDAIEAILTRRSVRTYLDKQIDKETVNELLKCAMSAPSAYQEEPWHFIITEKKEILQQIAEIHPHAKMAPKAPLGILICADMHLNKTKDLWPQDCSAATQNLLLAARAKGIGSVWTGIYPNNERTKDFQKLFKLPENVTPFAFIVLGYPTEEMKEEDRFDKKRIHFNQWS